MSSAGWTWTSTSHIPQGAWSLHLCPIHAPLPGQQGENVWLTHTSRSAASLSRMMVLVLLSRTMLPTSLP